jgi:hypothetical protein
MYTRIALNCIALSKTRREKKHEKHAVDEFIKCIITTETQRKKRIAVVGGNAEIPKNQCIKTSPYPYSLIPIPWFRVYTRSPFLFLTDFRLSDRRGFHPSSRRPQKAGKVKSMK